MLTDTQKIELVRAYQSGDSAYALSNKFGITPTAIYGLLKRRDIARRDRSHARREYDVDDQFFDEINTQEKAYFLGFLFADGYNLETRNAVSISLAEPDRRILEEMNALVQPDKPLQYVKYKGKRQNQYRLTMQNKRISRRLSELGCHQRKSYDLSFPVCVSESLMPHFVRGYFDGDGSIILPRRRSNVSVSFVGSVTFISGLRSYLADKCHLSMVKMASRFESEPRVVQIAYCGVNNVIRLRDMMYKDARILLRRKFEKFQTISRKMNICRIGEKHEC
jgi:hypothetical protein